MMLRAEKPAADAADRARLFERRALFAGSRLFSPFLAFLYPPSCLNCGAPLESLAALLCCRCIDTMHTAHPLDPLYRRAEALLSADGAVETLVVPFYFKTGGPLQALIHGLKYDGMTSVGEVLGRQIALRLPPIGPEQALVIPVPLHKAKYRERGYNQVDHIARGITAMLGLPLRRDIMRRLRYTGSQTRLDTTAREANVSGAFGVRRGKGADLRNRLVLLVDDVVTTGATMRACAKAIRQGGAGRVIACAAALAE